MQADKSRRLGGDAVNRHELLLLADRVEEAEGVRAEADHADCAERQEAEHGRHRHSPALTPVARREHDERQHQAGRDLHADAHHQRSRGRAKARARAGAQGQRRREHHQHQRVVVRAADRQHEQHRVEPDECRRPSPRLPEPPRRARDERDRA